MLGDRRKCRGDALITVILFACVACIVLAFWAIYVDAKDWQAFKAEHNCKTVALIRGDTFNTFGVTASGRPTVGVGVTPDKTGWLCDDGVTYYR